MSDTAPGAGGSAPGVNPSLAAGADLPPGYIVGEYRIEGIVGRGGMGVVYMAMQPVIEKKVAIKVLAAHFSSTPDLVRRFVDEARAVNRIGHENIIDIFSFGQLSDGRQYFIMEYLQGATLAERQDQGDLQPAEIPPILAQVCDALDAAHAKQIIHRDLKPENIWIATSSRGAPKVRLLDFGIAKLLDTGDRVVTDIGAVMGTPNYMSPEQCHGRGVDHRTDIYALGVMLYRIFSGRLPFSGETFAEILAKQVTLTPPPPSTYAALPAELDRLIMQCLEKNPALRPHSAGDLGATLAAIFAASGAGIALPRAGDSGRVMSASMVSSKTELAAPNQSGPVSAKTELASPKQPAAVASSQAQREPTANVIATVPSPGRRWSPLVGIGLVLVALAAIGVAWLSRRPAAPADKSTAAEASRTAPSIVSPPAAVNPAPVPAAPPPGGVPAPALRAPQAQRPVERGAGNRRRLVPGAIPAEPIQAVERAQTADPTQTVEPVRAPPKTSRASSNGLVTRNPFE